MKEVHMHTFEDWVKVLSDPFPSRVLGSLPEYPPELAALMGLQQDPKAHPEGDALVHTMLVVDNAALVRDKVPGKVEFMFAALLHDVGKAVMDFGADPHYKGHAEFSTGLAAVFLHRIDAPMDVRERVVAIIRNHHAPFDVGEHETERWKAIAGEVPLKVLAWFSRCDSFAGARRNEAPVLAVHPASERVFRVDNALKCAPKV